MSLHKTMIEHGHSMFRWRSYLPLFFIGPFFLAFREAAFIESVVGDLPEDIWVLFCFLLSISGLAIRWMTVGFVPAGTSGRNTKDQRAERLNTTGMYSVVRNPLYLGNYITLLGILLSIKVWWLVLIVSFAFFIYMERIILAEEDFLHQKFGWHYDNWRGRTPVIVPKLSLWQAPNLEFSLRTVLKREYQGLLAVGTAFFATEFIVDIFFEKEGLLHWLREDMVWPVVYAFILVSCLTLRYLKKHTTVLKVEGR